MSLTRKVSLTLFVSLLLTSCSPTPKKPGLQGLRNPPKPDGMMVDHMGAGDKPADPKKAAAAVDAILSETMDCQNKPTEGRKSLRLLTKDEYKNSLTDILKIKDDPTGVLPPEVKVHGFRNNVEKGRVSSDHLQAYIEIAVNIADAVKPQLQTLAGCTEDAGEACAQKVIATIAPKLYRRPLTDAEKAQALATYKKGLAVSAREGMTLLLSSLLISPSFLYRSEIGDQSGKLTPWEIASALSFFFWGTSPDDQLTSLAASGKLLDEATMLAEAERLWKDKRSRFITDEFSRGWLHSLMVKGSSKDAKLNFPQEIKDLMAQEAEDTFDYLMKQPKGTFASLFTNDFTIGSPKLAEFYKGQSVNEGGVSKIKFPNMPRKGLVTLGGVMASHASSIETHPIKRGEFVLTNMLCFVPPPTPAGLNVQVPAPKEGMTTRQRFAEHSKSDACKGCHLKIDGIGFGLEDFDTLGLYRDMDNGLKVDDAGELVGVDGTNTKFNGAGAMSEILAESTQAKRCFSLQWYRLAHGRTIEEGDGDLCAARDIAVKFSKDELSLSELLVKIISSPSYVKRGP